VDFVEWQAFVKEVRQQWGLLWLNRIDDRVRAEGVADGDYSLLFVDKGMVILATRDFRMPDLREILELHRPAEVFNAVQPPPSVGGWRKFVRETVSQSRPRRKRRAAPLELRKPDGQQKKKGGRGWLHRT